MKIFGPEFDTIPMSCYPLKAQTFDTLEQARSNYAYFLEECDRWGQTPASAALYIGEPDGDEENYGYPDYPDYLISQGPRGGVTTRRLA